MHELLIDPTWRLNTPADAAGAFASSNNIAANNPNNTGRVGPITHNSRLSGRHCFKGASHQHIHIVYWYTTLTRRLFQRHLSLLSQPVSETVYR